MSQDLQARIDQAVQEALAAQKTVFDEILAKTKAEKKTGKYNFVGKAWRVEQKDDGVNRPVLNITQDKDAMGRYVTFVADGTKDFSIWKNEQRQFSPDPTKRINPKTGKLYKDAPFRFVWSNKPPKAEEVNAKVESEDAEF